MGASKCIIAHLKATSKINMLDNWIAARGLKHNPCQPNPHPHTINPHIISDSILNKQDRGLILSSYLAQPVPAYKSNTHLSSKI